MSEMQLTNKSDNINHAQTLPWKKWLFYILVFLLFFLLVLPISPLDDDWYYSTAPNPDFQLEELLPGQTFWRPFDVLFGALMAYMPKLFPSLNRALVIFAHVLSGALLVSIAKSLNMKTLWRRFAVCFFLFSSANLAVLVSPDGLNQAFSLLFGVIAIYVHLKKGGYYYIPLCLIATLWKESGVSWFFVVPIIDIVANIGKWNEFRKDAKAIKKLAFQVLCSFAGVALYFAARFLLSGGFVLGSDSGRYRLSIISVTTIKNIVALFGSAASGIDSIALYGQDRSLLLLGITAVLSLVFVVAMLVCVVHMLRTKQSIFSLLCIVICVFGLALPLVVIGNAGEMHAYPVLFGMAVLYSFCFDRAGFDMKRLLIPIACIFLSFVISSGHKFSAIYDYSAQTRQFTQELTKVYDTPDETILFIEVAPAPGYSVFMQSGAVGSCYGLSLRPQYNWEKLRHSHYIAKTEEAAASYVNEHGAEYEAIYIVRDGAIEKVK